jgi:hypothetical protein
MKILHSTYFQLCVLKQSPKPIHEKLPAHFNLLHWDMEFHADFSRQIIYLYNTIYNNFKHICYLDSTGE